MSFFQVALVVLFIIGLSITSFLFGIAVSENYHKRMKKAADHAAEKSEATLRRNFYWQAGYMPSPEPPVQREVYQLPAQFEHDLKKNGHAVIRFQKKG